MESIINAIRGCSKTSSIASCNPCCNGINHKPTLVLRVNEWPEKVVILVVMESIINDEVTFRIEKSRLAL